MEATRRNIESVAGADVVLWSTATRSHYEVPRDLWRVAPDRRILGWIGEPLWVVARSSVPNDKVN